MNDQPDLLSHHNHFAELPNATTSLVLGIISIIGSCCFGIAGVICGTIGLLLANKDYRLYIENPGLYSTSSYKVSNAGKICSIVGISLGGLMLIGYLFGNMMDWFI